MKTVTEAVQNYYTILRIQMNANLEAIKKAYKTQALKYHPDKNPQYANDERLKKRWLDISEAYETLSDTDKRKQYDSTLQNSHTSFSNYLDSTDDEFSIEDQVSTQSNSPSQSTSPLTIDTSSTPHKTKAAKNEINEIYERFKAEQIAEAQRKAQTPQSPHSPLMQKLHTVKSNTAPSSLNSSADDLTTLMKKATVRQQTLKKEVEDFQDQINSNNPISPHKQNSSNELSDALKKIIQNELKNFQTFLESNKESSDDIMRLIALQHSMNHISTKSGMQHAFKTYLDNYRENTRIIEGNQWIRTLILHNILAPKEKSFWKDVSSLARQIAPKSPKEQQTRTTSNPNMRH